MYEFLVAVSTLYLLVGLVKPGWVLPGALKPNRWKVLGVWFLLAMVSVPFAPEPAEDVATSQPSGETESEPTSPVLEIKPAVEFDLDLNLFTVTNTSEVDWVDCSYELAFSGLENRGVYSSTYKQWVLPRQPREYKVLGAMYRRDDGRSLKGNDSRPDSMRMLCTVNDEPASSLAYGFQ